MVARLVLVVAVTTLAACTSTVVEERTPHGRVAQETVGTPPAPVLLRNVMIREQPARRTASTAKVTKALGYHSHQTLVHIRGTKVAPDRVRPGEDVSFTMEYAILAPSDVKSFEVRESWMLEKDGVEVTRTTPNTAQRAPGGWQSAASVTLPQDAPPGTYMVRSLVDSSVGRQEDLAYFIVE
jgi:hypothetical protein